jgi:hypothetical protein
MATDVNSDRQYPLTAFIYVNYDDIAYDVPTKIFDLPAGVIITKLWHKLVTAFADDASETQTMDIGTSGGGVVADPNAFTATPLDVDGTANTVSGQAASTEVGLYRKYTAPVNVTVELLPSSGTAVMTAGQLLVGIEYIVDGRGNENQD